MASPGCGIKRKFTQVDVPEIRCVGKSIEIFTHEIAKMLSAALTAVHFIPTYRISTILSDLVMKSVCYSFNLATKSQKIS